MFSSVQQKFRFIHFLRFWISWATFHHKSENSNINIYYLHIYHAYFTSNWGLQTITHEKNRSRTTKMQFLFDMHIVKNCTQLLSHQTCKSLQGCETYYKCWFLTMYQTQLKIFVKIRRFTMHLSMDSQRVDTVLCPWA